MSQPIAILGKPDIMAPLETKVEWLMAVVEKLAAASQDGMDTIADAYEVANPPASPVRTFDPSSATTADVANVLATLLADYTQRGVSGGTA